MGSPRQNLNVNVTNLCQPKQITFGGSFLLLGAPRHLLDVKLLNRRCGPL